MNATPIEVSAMQRAIALSALGLGTTSPNPPVGCVILDSEGRIVGEGYHERKGEPHAEANALAAAGERAAGGTAIVTLEPCNHHGRTPPCHQALIDAGVARVVVAVLDPTSRGEGGAARLREAGVKVEVGVRADEARLVLGPWLQALHDQRPWVSWAYYVNSSGLGAVPDELVEESGLRYGFDTVLREDGSLEEGVHGTHGRGAFTIPDTHLKDGVAAFLSSLYAEGTRLLLVNGGLPLAAPFLDAGVIDEARAYFPSAGSSLRGVEPPDGWLLAPPGFRLQRVAQADSVVMIVAIPNRLRGCRLRARG